MKKLDLHHVVRVKAPQFHSNIGSTVLRRTTTLGSTRITTTRHGQSFSFKGAPGVPSQSYSRHSVRMNFAEGAGYSYRKVRSR
jgi:hypothetical protein